MSMSSVYTIEPLTTKGDQVYFLRRTSPLIGKQLKEDIFYCREPAPLSAEMDAQNY
jgi:hypothetical protein